MTPEKPAEVEIRVDGRVVHRSLARELKTHEGRAVVRLEAEKWLP